MGSAKLSEKTCLYCGNGYVPASASLGITAGDAVVIGMARGLADSAQKQFTIKLNQNTAFSSCVPPAWEYTLYIELMRQGVMQLNMP